MTREELDAEERELRARRLALDAKWLEFRKACPHDKAEYVPDASGNNDDGFYCRDCKAWI